MKNQYLFEKTLDCVSKLDNIILDKLEHYEKYHNLNKFKIDIHKFIVLFDKYKFNIIDVNSKKFELDYLIYLNDDYIINININFSEKGEYMFFIYNNIYLLSKYGELLNNWTTDIMIWLNEE